MQRFKANKKKKNLKIMRYLMIMNHAIFSVNSNNCSNNNNKNKNNINKNLIIRN